MTEMYPLSRLRTKAGLGVWEHRGKVAVAGIGFAPTMRRWDGSDMSTAVGALTIVAAQKALDDAGISRGEIDGVVAAPRGMGDNWAPRPYFAPPYDTEDGLSGTSADWLVKNMGLWNARTTFHSEMECFSTALVTAAQVVGDGLAHTVLVTRGLGNPPGRYHQAPTTHYGEARQWGVPWDWRLEPLIAYGFELYCRKYNTNHDRMAPFVVNQHRNGLMFPEGFYYQHRPTPITREDYLNARWVCKPMSMADMDLPIQTAVAFVMTTAERAKHMKQKPVYVLNHCTQRGVFRSTTETLDETEAFSDNVAKMCYEGSGLTPSEVDIFNPYDGYTLFSQYFLEAFHWHGVKRGEAHDFYAGDISVEGPHPFSSSGGNSGNGRTRAWLHYDCIQQLRGQAGKRQVRIRHETAASGAFTPGHTDWMIWCTSPD